MATCLTGEISTVKYKDEKGTVTIYLVIVFMAMILFIGLFLDLARIKVAQNQLRRAANTSARSVLAEFNTPLHNGYGLFATNKPNRQAELDRYVKANLSLAAGQRFDLLSFRYEGSELLLGRPIADPPVLKQQILEEMKYAAPIGMAQDLLDKFKMIRGTADSFKTLNQSRKQVRSINDDIKRVGEINRDLKNNREKMARAKESLASLDRESDSVRGGGSGGTPPGQLKAQKTALQQEIRTRKAAVDRNLAESQETRNEIQAKLDALEKRQKVEPNSSAAKTGSQPETGSLDGTRRSLDQSVKKLKQEAAALGENREQRRTDPPGSSAIVAAEAVSPSSNGDVDAAVDTNLKLMDDIFGLEGTLAGLRDQLFVNEYALARLSYQTDPKGGAEYRYKSTEVEYILFSGMSPGASPEAVRAEAAAKIYGVRFALDMLAYFAFSKIPEDPLLRTIYALAMAAIDAADDTKILRGGGSVLIAEMRPSSANPLAKLNIRLNYKDHLRLLLLLDQDENRKLTRIAELIEARSGIDPGQSYTQLGGQVNVSIPLWFLPLAGVQNLDQGPFDTRIREGRCYISKTVEFSY